MVSRNETFDHPTAIILAVSTLSPDPLNAFAQLYASTQAQNCDVFGARPYVDPNILRYYVLIHDASQGGEISESITLLESIKKIYGLDCCILPINSAAGEPDPNASATSDLWSDVLSSSEPRRLSLEGVFESSGKLPSFGMKLDGEDVKRLHAFVREFVAQSLIPWMERCVSHLNESVTASRKGITGRLFGAGKKFFGQTSSRSSGSSNDEKPRWDAQGGFYWHTAMEAQTRRLADFAFSLRDYKLAAASYDLGRKDYAADKAHNYAAGANEMFGLSHLMLMMGSKAAPIDVDSYLAASDALFRNSPLNADTLLRTCRSTMLYYEAYQAIGFNRPAPAALLRTAQGPGGADLEVLGALLLEQAAYAVLKTESSRPATRKWALYLVMAGLRYQQCGAKALCLRCLDGARNIYEHQQPPSKSFLDEENGQSGEDENQQTSTSPGWPLIQSHVDHELGKQAFREGNAESAVEHLLRTLRPLHVSTTLQEHQKAYFAATLGSVQKSYLEDFLAAYESAASTQGGEIELELPHPLIDTARTQLTPTIEASGVQKFGFTELEQRYADLAKQGGLGFAGLQPNQQQTISQGEAVSFQLTLQNPLCCQLAVSDIRVHVSDAASGSEAGEVSVEAIPDAELSPLEERTITTRIIASIQGRFKIDQISYRLQERVPLIQPLVKQGVRLNQTAEQRKSRVPQYAEDQTLLMIVKAPSPSLSIEISQPIAPQIFLGEEIIVDLKLINTGSASLANLHMLTNDNEAVCSVDDNVVPSKSTYTVSNALCASRPTLLLPAGEILEPKGNITKQILLRGTAVGPAICQILYVFSGPDGRAGKAHWAHQVEVLPTIDVGVEVNPAPTGFAYLLGITAVNLTPSRESLAIQKVQFVSPRWQSNASILPTDAPGVSQPAFRVLVPEQACTAYAGLTEASPDQSEHAGHQMLDHTVEQLRAQLRGRDVKQSARPGSVQLHVSTASDGAEEAVDYDSLSRVYQVARSKWRRRALEHQFPTVSAADRERIFTVYQPEDLDVVVHWEAKTDDGEPPRRGQIFIFGLSLGPSCSRIRSVLEEAKAATGGRTMYEETAQQRAALLASLTQSSLAAEEDPVVVDIEVPSEDSENSSSVTVPVIFNVRNMSTMRYARCIVELDSAVDPDASLRSGSEGLKATWNGRLTLRSAVIPPKSHTSLTARALRPRVPGTQLTSVLMGRSHSGTSNKADGSEVGVENEDANKQCELPDWSIKVDVLPDDKVAVEGRSTPLAHFNSGRLRSGRFISLV